MEAFWELHTTRHLGMGMGPIPWNHIIEYGLAAGLEPDMLEVFRLTMREMDNAYLEWMGKQADRNTTDDTGGKSIPGPSGRKIGRGKGSRRS